MNYGTFAGRLGGDAELRTTPSGKQVCAFSIGVTTGYGDKKSTLWVNCTLWGERGQKLAQYLTKGLPVAVTGEVNVRAYSDKGGNARASLEVNVQAVTMLGSAERSHDGRTPEQRPAAGNDDFGDSIPF